MRKMSVALLDHGEIVPGRGNTVKTRITDPFRQPDARTVFEQRLGHAPFLRR